jgi:hypothetical protein
VFVFLYGWILISRPGLVLLGGNLLHDLLYCGFRGFCCDWCRSNYFYRGWWRNRNRGRGRGFLDNGLWCGFFVIAVFHQGGNGGSNGLLG